jgi:hypothetical protein
MAAGHRLLHDPRGGGADQIGGGIDLFPGGDVVAFAGQQVKRTGDILQRQFAAQPGELALGKEVAFEQKVDRLQVIAPRQVDRVLVPAFEMLGPGDVIGILGMGVQVDELAQILLVGMHVLPAGQHVLPQHPPLARGDHLLIHA